MQALIIHCPKLTSRVLYAFEFIFEQFEGIDFRLIESQHETNPFHYSIEFLNAEVHLPASKEWCEKTFFVPNIGTELIEMALEAVKNQSYEINYDLPAAIFIMLSRLEEYGAQSSDPYGRFSSNQSILYEKGLLEIPVVDFWLKAFEKQLRHAFPDLNLKLKERDPLLLTVDIDNAYAFRHRGWIKNSKSLIGSFVTFDFSGVLQKIKIGLGKAKDPFDTYDQLLLWAKACRNTIHFFFLVGDPKGKDYNIGYQHPALRELISKLKKSGALIGLHPSLATQGNLQKLIEEKTRIEALLQTPVVNSRQHYLRYHVPETPSALLAAGIMKDFSLGFYDAIGFRAGTGRSFYFYDFTKEETTSLLLVPFAAMDTTLLRYMKLTPSDALDRLKVCFTHAQKLDTTFTLLMHNESLSEYGPWKGWSTIFERFIQFACPSSKL